LTLRGIQVDVRVFAVPGARSSGLTTQVRAASAWSPALAVIVIGANDLTHREPVAAAVQSLADAVRLLREAGTEVVVAPAPDLSSVPHVPVFLRGAVRAAGESLREKQVVAVLKAGGHVADADERAARAFAGDASLFSADRFHPSSAGYAVIADALLPSVLVAAEKSGAASASSPDLVTEQT
jgi:lysophospholipase L1-like esterase